jgi:carbon-monoxide dehydrogenase medium subunit
MTNSHILSQEFDYAEPRTVEEALSLLDGSEEKTRVVAGGTDLLVQMKMGKIVLGHLVSLARIPGLRYLIVDRGLRIGALTSFRQIEKEAVIREKYTALYEAARSVTSVQIKHMGTLGGNLCNASPAADSAPALLVLAAEVKLATRKGERQVPVDQFFAGPGETILTTNELLIEVEVPEVLPGTGSAFLKMGRISADLAKVSVAAMIVREGEVIQGCRIAMGSVAKTPLRMLETERVLIGKEWNDDLIDRAGDHASQEIEPITDIRSTAGYRRELTKVLVRDALKIAWKRAG